MNQNERAAESLARAHETLRRADAALEDAERARAARQERGDVWAVPPEPPEPSPRPQPAPRAARAPSPPTAQKYVRPEHGKDGRIIGAETFEGDAAQAAKSWEHWIRALVDQKIAALIDPVGKALAVQRKQMEAGFAVEIAALRASVEKLTGALERLEQADKELRQLDRLDGFDPAGVLPH